MLFGFLRSVGYFAEGVFRIADYFGDEVQRLNHSALPFVTQPQASFVPAALRLPSNLWRVALEAVFANIDGTIASFVQNHFCGFLPNPCTVSLSCFAQRVGF